METVDCPACGGWGGESYDTTDSSFEHTSRDVPCENCGGSGEVEACQHGRPKNDCDDCEAASHPTE